MAFCADGRASLFVAHPAQLHYHRENKWNYRRFYLGFYFGYQHVGFYLGYEHFWFYLGDEHFRLDQRVYFG